MLKDVTSLELECKAECVPMKVVLQPYAIYVKGRSLLGTTVRRQFTVSDFASALDTIVAVHFTTSWIKTV